jgi:RNA polymerase sigma factor (sigma-70 family)
MPFRYDEGSQKRASGRSTWSWKAVWERAYAQLQRGPARGWQPADWEDMAQDAVCKAIIALQDGTVEAGQFDKWFAVMVRNLARDYWRKKYGRTGERAHLPWQETPDAEDQRQADEFARILAQHDVHTLLAQTPSLHPHERTALELWYWYECSDENIAAVLATRASTVRGWLRAARAKLAQAAKNEV